MTVLLPIAAVDETPEARNSRRAYEEGKLNELAASIAEHGVLQPILVIPSGDRYRVIAGNRRLKAAARAGLERIPAIVRSETDENTMFLWNIVENIQRVDLTAAERIKAIRQLAETGLGVREVSRGTGLSAGTISRWIRIADKPAVLRALEDGRLDIFGAMELAQVKDPDRLDQLIEAASSMSQKEFAEMVRGASRGDSVSADERRLAEIRRQIAQVQNVTPAGIAQLKAIHEAVVALLAQASSAASPEEAHGAPNTVAGGSAFAAGSLAATGGPADADADGSPAGQLPVLRYETGHLGQFAGHPDDLLINVDAEPARGPVAHRHPALDGGTSARHRDTRPGKLYTGRRFRIGSMEVNSVHVGDGLTEVPLYPVDPDPSVLFEFGRVSAGALLLARSILAEVLGRSHVEQHGDLGQAFMREKLAQLEGDEWTMTEAEIRAWAESAETLRSGAR
jgi:ParB/RepB/Spo0J family partition protein